jgi:hypothetical protein
VPAGAYVLLGIQRALLVTPSVVFFKGAIQ